MTEPTKKSTDSLTEYLDERERLFADPQWGSWFLSEKHLNSLMEKPDTLSTWKDVKIQRRFWIGFFRSLKRQVNGR